MHSHQNSISSMSSLSTYHDEKYIEKLNQEKNNFEKQYVELKFEYAEILSKLNDLESQYDKILIQNKVLYI